MKMDNPKNKVDIDAIVADLKKTNVKFNAEFVNKFIDVIYEMINDLAYENERREKEK